MRERKDKPMEIINYGTFAYISSRGYSMILTPIRSGCYNVALYHHEGGKLYDVVLSGKPRNVWLAVYHDIRSAGR